MERINRLVEPHIFEKNFYWKDNKIRYYPDGTRFRVIFTTNKWKDEKVFKTLEEAKEYKKLCEENIRKAKYKNSVYYDKLEKYIEDFKDYPENLLNELDLDYTDETLYNQIIPNFEYNFNKVKVILSPREEKLIDLKYRQTKTLREIAKEYNVTHERIRQILAKAIRKLRVRKNIFFETEEKMYLLDKATEAKIIEEAREKINDEVAFEYLNKLIENKDYEKIFAIQEEIDNALFSNKLEKEKFNKNIPLEDLDFSVRTYNCLRRYGCETLGDIPTSETELMKIRNLGRKSLKEILCKFKEYGIKYKTYAEEYLEGEDYAEYEDND